MEIIYNKESQRVPLTQNSKYLQIDLNEKLKLTK